MTSYPSKKRASSKNASSSKVSARSARDITNGQLGSYILRNHAKYYVGKRSALTTSYVIGKEYYNHELGYAFPPQKLLAPQLGKKERALRDDISAMRDAKDENGNPLWRIVIGKNSAGVPVANRYYPLFLPNVLAEWNKHLEKDDLDWGLTWEEDTAEGGTSAAKPDDVTVPDVPVFDTDQTEPVEEVPETTVVPVMETEDTSAPTVTEQVSQESTNRDQEILAIYREAQELREDTGFRWEVPLPAEGQVVDVLPASELVRFRDHGNPDKIFVAGTEDVFLEEMAGKWITKFGSNFGKTITPSYIQGVYDELTDNVDGAQVMKRDSVMYVLGSKGIKPTAGFVKFLLSNNTDVTPEQAELRRMIEATVVGRTQTLAYMRKNLYGNYTLTTPEDIAAAEARAHRTVYSDQM